MPRRNKRVTIRANLSLMENIILHEIDMGIMKGKHYKEIYKDCKERLETVKDLRWKDDR